MKAVPASTACMLLRYNPDHITCSVRPRGISISPHDRARGEVAPVAVATATATLPSPHVRHDSSTVRSHPGLPERLAVVTGANKGIGLEVCRQLALQGVTVILTAMDANEGEEAAESIRHESNLSNIIFRQLDIRDIDGANSLAKFIQSTYGKVDILVNNAAVTGLVADEEGLRALNIDGDTWISGRAASMIQDVLLQTYDEAVNCINTNYYGYKHVTEALLPLLKQSTSGARIVNVTSIASELTRLPNEKLRNDLRDAENWDEHRIDAMLDAFLEDLKKGRLEQAGWSMMLPAYSISKMAVNQYTRILARRHPEMLVNCVHPGFVRTEMNWNMGTLSPAEGARGPVMLALLPDDDRNRITGCYFDETTLAKAW
ncbi:hypothetical protein EJB05_10484, partial [Eragrostis curvula]